jgi:hypothetical protein
VSIFIIEAVLLPDALEVPLLGLPLPAGGAGRGVAGVFVAGGAGGVAVVVPGFPVAPPVVPPADPPVVVPLALPAPPLELP